MRPVFYERRLVSGQKLTGTSFWGRTGFSDWDWAWNRRRKYSIPQFLKTSRAYGNLSGKICRHWRVIHLFSENDQLKCPLDHRANSPGSVSGWGRRIFTFPLSSFYFLKEIRRLLPPGLCECLRRRIHPSMFSRIRSGHRFQSRVRRG